MTTTDTPASLDTTTTSAGRMFATGALAGLAGGVAALAVALIALALGVSLDVTQPGGGIASAPLPAFVIFTIVQSLIGAGLALVIQRWAARPRFTFVVTTAVLVVLTFAQPLVAAQDAASAFTLIMSHVAAAAVVVPALARLLPDRR